MDESQAFQRFGKETINYYAGSTLNRYSFLRTDNVFLRNAASHPATRYIALESLNPLVAKETDLAYLSFKDVSGLVGEAPFQVSEEENIKNYDSARLKEEGDAVLVAFLGVHPTVAADVTIATAQHGDVKGTPYFAVDITAKGVHSHAAKALLEKQEKEGGCSVQTNTRAMTLRPEPAALFAQARSIFDWNDRNPFCAGCGQPTISTHAGYKRVCPPTDAQKPRDDCPTRRGVSNVCFPRTDPTMIAAVMSPDGQRVLLGRQARWPAYFYSTLAGFIEPGESIEEGVRREIWEEAGVKVDRVIVHSSQPWPYPSSLMIGAIAQAHHEDINLNDKELESAKWFTIDEVRSALENGVSSLTGPAPEGYREGDLRLPPGQAIANQLLTAVVGGYLTKAPSVVSGISKM